MKLSALALVACNSSPPLEPSPNPRPTPPSTNAPMSEPIVHINALSNRSSKQMAEQAEAWLASHPVESHPLLLEALTSRGPSTARILRVLGTMGHPDSVGEIAALLNEGDELLASAAATALAHHPSPNALQELIGSTHSDNPNTRHAALIGLRRRSDASACAQITSLLNHSNPTTRYQSLRTVAELGGLNREDAQRMTHDEDPDVKALAQELMSPSE